MSFDQKENNELILPIGYGLAFVIIILVFLFLDHRDNETKEATIQACLNHGGAPAECAKLGR